MPHFSAAVFSAKPEDAEQLMLPYDMRVFPGAPYAVFQDHPRAGVDRITGRPGFWVNPQARFDWWCIGGRWHNGLRIRSVNDTVIRANQARADLVDFTCEPEAYERSINHWNFYVFGTPMPGGQRNPVLKYKPEFYLDRFGTAEIYARAMSGFYAECFVDENGRWHAPAKIGAEGPDKPITGDERLRYVEELDQQIRYAKEAALYLTVCDCHI